jgi:hypothetical protein
MPSSPLLLLALLAALPRPGSQVVPERHVLPWYQATALAAKLQNERGLQAVPALGQKDGRQVVLAVVPLDPEGKTRVEVRTALAFFRMADAASRAGITLKVSSGFRSHAEQVEMYRQYVRGRGPLAAKPGSSNHQSGHALDIDTVDLRVRNWLRHNAFRYGFHRTVPSERWHWEHWGVSEPTIGGLLRDGEATDSTQLPGQAVSQPPTGSGATAQVLVTAKPVK